MPREERILPKAERAAKLRSVLAGLESLSGSKPVTARNQRQRVEEIRLAMTNLVNKEARGLCCCRQITVALEPEEFEADMNRPCVMHGRRNLGHIEVVTAVPPDRNDLLLLELLLQYRRG
jgi:hypothetical protein